MIGLTIAGPWRVRAGLSSSWIILVLLSSCGGIGDPIDPCRDADCVGGETTVRYWATRGTRAIDILLIVDERVGASPEGPKLASALARMMGNLDWPLGIGGSAIDLHVAMVSAAATDATGNTAPPMLWPTSPSCANPSGPFLRATQLCDESSNFSGALSEAVVCAALHVPASGRSPRPIDTLRTVLSPGGLGESTGFRRQDVQLIVAIVSTEEDPYLVDSGAVAAAHDLLANVAPNPDNASVVGIVGPAEAEGLLALATYFGDDGAFSAATDPVWSSLPFTTEVRLSVDGWPGYRDCLDWPVVDAQPDLEGIQPDCVATEIHRSSTEQTEEIMPACTDSASASGRCWRPSRTPNPCPAGTFEFRVEPQPLACQPNYSIIFTLTCALRHGRGQRLPRRRASRSTEANMAGSDRETRPSVILRSRKPGTGAAMSMATLYSTRTPSPSAVKRQPPSEFFTTSPST
jgi:hypothetical protein